MSVQSQGSSDRNTAWYLPWGSGKRWINSKLNDFLIETISLLHFIIPTLKICVWLIYTPQQKKNMTNPSWQRPLRLTLMSHWANTCMWGGLFMNDFSIVIQIQWEVHSCSLSCCNEVIAVKFCTWQDSCAVVACAKFCSDLIPYNKVTPKPIFHLIWITIEKSFIKLSHCGLVTPYGNRDLGQHWLR